MAEPSAEDFGALLPIRAQPRASRNAIMREADGRFRVALMAPPVEGAANKALRAFLAKTLGIRKADITLTKGEKSREKAVWIRGMTEEELTRRLMAAS